MTTPAEFCKKHNACNNGAAFAANFSTLAEIWDACYRPDWLLWMIEKAEVKGLDRELRLFACQCAEDAKPTDQRSINAIRVARLFAVGEATQEDMSAALAAARAAARAAAWDAHAKLLRSFIANPFEEQTP